MTEIFRTVGGILVTISLSIASFFGVQAPSQNVGATIPISVAVFTTSLQASITSSATSMTLVNGTNKAGNNLSGYTCFTIDEGTTIEEFVCGTATGTSIASMIRGIDPVDGDLEVTALKKAHRRGATVKITNYPALAIVSRILNGDETLPNKISYNSHPTFSSNTELIDKKYADDLAIAGAPDASTTVKGISEEATSAEINAGTATGGTSARLFVNPSDLASSNYASFLPSTGQKDALVGNNTDVAVGTGNKYVTQTGLQHNAEKYAADAGANDTYAITLSPVPTSYTNGMIVYFKANTANTGAATLNVNSLGAKTIVKGVNTTLADGDITAGMFVTVIYDGTNFVLQNPIANIVPSNKLYLSPSKTTMTGQTTEQTIASVTIPGGTLGTGNAIRFRTYMDVVNTVAETYVLKVKYGTTTIATGQTVTPSTAVLSGVLEFTLYANGATNSQYGVMLSALDYVLAQASTEKDYAHQTVEGTSAEDSTADKTLSVTITPSNTGITAHFYGMSVEQIR